ncbi:hypothetical protein BD310DRAFT_143965 [Dichomitus squalens]|uniref:Uncharacterized protein n=1 Tax=Dichomitus squalens TaxID=114155 RepID=A0A4Q9Q4A8_9APHY|nr:hypothetical protein BD310DRAFT_143965 [Dichomitus squalens]
MNMQIERELTKPILQPHTFVHTDKHRDQLDPRSSMWLSRMPVTWFNSFIRSPEYWFLASFSTFSLRTIKLCTWIRPRALWKRSSSVGLCSHLRPGDPSDPTGATIPRASIWTMRLLIALWRSWLLAVGQRTWRWDRGGRRRSDQWNGGGPRRMEFSVFCTYETPACICRRYIGVE